MKAHRIKDHDLLIWEECEVKDILKGDVFYTTDSGIKGPVLIAADDAIQVAHQKCKHKKVWEVRTKPF